MKKLTLTNGWPYGCLVLFCLLFGQSCRKDKISPSTAEDDQLIKQEEILQWVEDNPAAKLSTLDWNNAKQATINGHKVVRVPTINISTGVVIPGMEPKLLLSNQKTVNGKLSSTRTENQPSNPNYSDRHPPELFFVQDETDGKVKGALLNFVPTNPNEDFGKNGIWTGKLYSWNLSADTVWVQEIVKSKLKDRYGLKQKADR